MTDSVPVARLRKVRSIKSTAGWGQGILDPETARKHMLKHVLLAACRA
jgi:hypothetical protein